VLRPGDFYGHAEVLELLQERCEIVALEDTQIFVMTAEDFKTEICDPNGIYNKLLAFLHEDARSFVLTDPQIAQSYTAEKMWERRQADVVKPLLVEKDFNSTFGGAEANFRHTGRRERDFQRSRAKRPLKDFKHQTTTSIFQPYSHKRLESERLESPRTARHGHASHSLDRVLSRSEPIFEPFPYLARKAPPTSSLKSSSVKSDVQLEVAPPEAAPEQSET
jgi:hypothetical protein